MKSKFFCLLILVLFLLYLSQPVLGVQGRLGPLLIIAIFAFAVYYAIKLWSSNIPLTATTYLWLLFLIYNLIGYLFSSYVLEYAEMRSILLNLLPFFAFYYLSSKGVLTERHLIVFFYFLAVVFVINFWQSSQVIATQTGQEEFANNVSYHIIGLLPFVFLIPRKTIQLMFLVLFAYFALESMKRSVLIVSILSFLIYAYVNFESTRRRSTFIAVVSSLLILMTILIAAFTYYTKVGIGDKFEERLMLMIFEGHSSGRNQIALSLFNNWLDNSSFLNYLFGFGYMSWRDVLNNSAHNDLLKMLVDGGLIGVLIFIFLVISIVRDYWLGLSKAEYKGAYLMLILSLLVSAATSRWFGASFFYMNCLLLPFLISNNKYSKLNHNLRYNET